MAEIHETLDFHQKNALFWLLSTHALPPLPALEGNSADTNAFTVTDWHSLQPLLIYTAAAESVFRQTDRDGDGIKVQSPFSLTVLYASIGAVSACLSAVNR